MFAKLKQKIQLEGGTVTTEGERTVPGHASPRRISLTGSPAQSPLIKERVDDGFTSSREDLTKVDYSSKEDLISALQSRTEQCQKLETKVSDYMGAIKDNAKKTEKLEAYIEKQQDMLARRTKELNEQYQASRVQIMDKHQLELEVKEQEKQDLLERLRETESLKEKYSKREEETEEIQQFTDQEMGKLKHMLILKEEELSKCEKDLKLAKDRHKEFDSLENRLKIVESEKAQLEDASSSHGKVVSNLTKERMELDEQLSAFKISLEQKSTSASSLQSKYTDLENTHQSYLRNSELQRNKLSQQLQEKSDVIEQLEERVKLLQQREQDQALSGDDRLLALQKERDGLEKKLTESREQLSQIKSSWSDKISHLEDQISHLNGKIVEDTEELTEARNNTQAVREKLQKEIDTLKEKLRSAEKQAEINLDLAGTKEAQFKKEKLELETEISKANLEKVNLDTHLRAKLAAVESQVMSLELEKKQKTSQLQDQIAKLQHQLSESVGKLEKATEEISVLETERNKLMSEVKDLGKSCKSLQEELNNSTTQLQEVTSQLTTAQEQLKLTQVKLESTQENSKSKSTNLIKSNKEKDELMMRNAELSQQLTVMQQTGQDERRSLQHEKDTLEGELEARTHSETALKQQCQQLQSRSEELSAIQTEQVSSSEQLQEMEKTIEHLEDQLTEKNKALKKQEQRLNDLKKTLQRELKVQSLPNDEPIDPKMAALTPPLPRKNSGSRGSQHSDTPARVRRMNSHERSPIPGESVAETAEVTHNRNNSYGTQDFFVGQNLHPGLRGISDRHVYGGNSATISVNDSALTGYSGHHSKSRTSSINEFDTRHLEKDINFQYLKHVVMKFMLSRETEAIHLIKAVSLLLRFTPEEQKLIRDTLEWKMSWFGGSQPPAVLRGQTSKIVPPSY